MIFTIGYGNRSIDEFVSLLKREGVEYVGDVRSFPRSGYNPAFSQKELRNRLKNEGISYVFLGEEMGGSPDDEEVRVANPRSRTDTFLVDYEKQRSTEEFQRGFERMRRSQEIEACIALMCSEARPEDCHRTRLIGEALSSEGFRVHHIDEHGEVKSQSEVMLRISKGQSSLPGFGPPAKALLSSRGWRRSSNDLEEESSE